MNKASGTSQFFSSVGAVSFGVPMMSSKGAKTHVTLTLMMLISSSQASNTSEQVFNSTLTYSAWQSSGLVVHTLTWKRKFLQDSMYPFEKQNCRMSV